MNGITSIRLPMCKRITGCHTRLPVCYVIYAVMVFSAHLEVCFGGVEGDHIVGIDLLPPDYTSDPNYPGPFPPGCLIPPCIDFGFDFDIVTECDLCGGTEGPEMRVVALDCDGHVVAEEHRSFPPTAPCDSPPAIRRDPFTDVEFIFSACMGGVLISRIDVFTAFDHIQTNPSTSDCSSPSEVKWNAAPSASFDVSLPELSCALTAAELACFTCADVAPLPPDLLVIYKSQRKVYGLSTDDDSGASYGEVVNGSFIAPGPGLLFVEAMTSAPSVIAWSANVTSSGMSGGWYTQVGETGFTLSGEKCYAPGTAGETVDFHIRVGRVDRSFDYSLKFTWLAADNRNCCIEPAEEIVTFRVVPFSDETQSSDSSLPSRRIWVRHDGSVDYEMTLPLCTACTGGECHSENMSAPIIAWPTPDGAVIRDGHARGWSITSTSIKTPGPESTLYNY